MNIPRSLFDGFYTLVKPLVFRATKKDPQRAHELFIAVCRGLNNVGLDKFMLDNKTNKLQPPFELSNAGGFNKNGDIPPITLRYFGFDRVVIGTVTHDQWEGNPRPTIRRYVTTGSMVNWMGLPGDGSQVVADRLAAYGRHGVPLTINFMSTPQKQSDDVLRDLEETIKDTRDLPYVDRFELNFSCPNTHSASGALDAREENRRQLASMLAVVGANVHTNQDIYIKVSPDEDEASLDDILAVVAQHRVAGITATNTTSQHDPAYIAQSHGKGGASGKAVYRDSLLVQRLVHEKTMQDGQMLKLIACGGIDSVAKLVERVDYGAVGIQVYTPFIFKGPGFLRELRTCM